MPDEQAPEQRRRTKRKLRIRKRAHGTSTTALAEVLVQLYDWALERRVREAARTRKDTGR